MSKKSAFTLSLDCEGLWGMADSITPNLNQLINAKNLTTAYNFIRKVILENNLNATAAFVTSFAVNKEVVIDNKDLYQEIGYLVPNWFEHINKTINSDTFDGWSGNIFYKQMMKDGYEMAWHGTTHLPWSLDTPLSALEIEMKLYQRLLPCLDCRPSTVVFPRNIISNLEILKKNGFDTYRDALISNKVSNYFREWNLLINYDYIAPKYKAGWYVSPAGYFLNWPSGVRSTIPSFVTIERWKRLLHHVIDSGGNLHMWFHPHNLITAPKMQFLFSRIIKEVGILVRSGHLDCLTIKESRNLIKQ